MVFDYSKLPNDFQRHYLPNDVTFDWEVLARYYEDLSTREIGSASDLQKWMTDEDEFNAYLYEQRAIRYINSTRQTDNPEFTKAYQEYVEGLEPKLKVASFELLKKYIASKERGALPVSEYLQENRRREAAFRMFRVENVELEKNDSNLGQEYQRTRGAMTVNFRGQERTLSQMAKFLEETDRGIREESWRLSSARVLQDKDTLEAIYDKMVALRNDEALNAGFESYEAYVFVKKSRFDYSPNDCSNFHDAVEQSIVPLSREIDRLRREKLGVDVLRPWDLNVDPEGRPPLAPFKDTAGLVKGASKVVAQVDEQLSGYFTKMVELDLLDLDSRKGKAPGGYQDELSERRLPFIFMNAAGVDGDIRVLLHEAGHSFHSFLMKDSRLPFYNANASLPTEFSEVASTTMEMISGEHYEGVFYNGEDAKRSNWEEIVANVKLFTWVATIDAFQHWVYLHPGHSREERRQAWLKTLDRFCGLESFEGLEESRSYRWQRQLHLYEVPFYYVEYAIALTGALGIWARYRKDRRDAIDAYKSALSLGARKPLPELFRSAGLEWGFGSEAMARIAGEIRSALKEFES